MFGIEQPDTKIFKQNAIKLGVEQLDSEHLSQNAIKSGKLDGQSEPLGVTKIYIVIYTMLGHVHLYRSAGRAIPLRINFRND